MRLFTGIWKKEHTDSVQIKPVERSVLDRALFYAEHLTLPEPSGKALVCLAESKKKEEVSGTGSWYIRFLSDGTKEGDMNAGYLAGQVAAFLRFQGNTGISLHRIQDNGRNTADTDQKKRASGKMCCRAVLTTGGQEHTERRRRRIGSQEDFGVYTERRENWDKELLSYAKHQYPGMYRRLNASCKDGWIHFSGKKLVGRHTFADGFETGVAAAQIMAAAEMLWVELELSRMHERTADEYLFSVRKREVFTEPLAEKGTEKEEQRDTFLVYA